MNVTLAPLTPLQSHLDPTHPWHACTQTKHKLPFGSFKTSTTSVCLQRGVKKEADSEDVSVFIPGLFCNETQGAQHPPLKKKKNNQNIWNKTNSSTGENAIRDHSETKGGVGVSGRQWTFPMPVDTADARWAGMHARHPSCGKDRARTDSSAFSQLSLCFSALMNNEMNE